MEDLTSEQIIRYLKLHILGSDDIDEHIIWIYNELQLVFENLHLINIEPDNNNSPMFLSKHNCHIRNYGANDNEILFQYRERTREILISLSNIWLYFNYKYSDIFTYRCLKKVILWYVNDKFGIKAENVQIKKWS